MPGPKILRHDIVDVGRGDEPADRQTDALRDETRRQIAEISAGNRHDEAVIVGRPSQTGQQEIIDHLRKEPAQIDGVCRGQPHSLAQFVISKRLLDEALTVIKGAGTATAVMLPPSEAIWASCTSVTWPSG